MNDSTGTTEIDPHVQFGQFNAEKGVPIALVCAAAHVPYHRLLRAVLAGTFPAKRLHGRWFFDVSVARQVVAASQAGEVV